MRFYLASCRHMHWKPKMGATQMTLEEKCLKRLLWKHKINQT